MSAFILSACALSAFSFLILVSTRYERVSSSFELVSDIGKPPRAPPHIPPGGVSLARGSLRIEIPSKDEPAPARLK
eukprot:1069406-Rhodomonas_salina.1